MSYTDGWGFDSLQGHVSAITRGCSSGVERDAGSVDVEGSIPSSSTVYWVMPSEPYGYGNTLITC